MITANTTHSHFASELLKVENVHKAKTAHTARIINCMKLIENPIIEKAIHEKNHFFICCGNITFIYHFVGIKSYDNYIYFKKIRKFLVRIFIVILEV